MRARLTILGSLWGFLAGLGVCAAVLPALAVFLEFFVAGRGPAASGTALADRSFVAVSAGILLAATGVGGVVGFLCARAFERKGSPPPARRVAQLFAGTLALYLVLGLLAVQRFRQEGLDLAARARTDEAYCALANSLHRVTAVRCGARPDGSGFDVLVETRGTRAGSYEISLLVSENLYHFTMFSANSAHDLVQPGESTALFVPYPVLVDAYRRNVFKDRPVDVSGDAFLAVAVTLKPVLTPGERAALPSYTPSCRAADGSVRFLELKSAGESELLFAFRLRSGAPPSELPQPRGARK
jgi:hypothetical protein